MQSIIAARSLVRPSTSLLAAAPRRSVLAVPSRSLLTSSRPSISQSSPRPTLRALPSQHLALVQRSYATHDHIISSFSTPFAQFIHTLSRIARIITFSALSAFSLAALLYEGTHQYVEHVAMPRSHSSLTGDDAWGWGEEAAEESWGVGKGTDARLGFKGRHAVRSAWTSAHWGGGISPLLLFSAPRSPGSIGKSASAPGISGLHASDGLRMAEQCLDLALRVAEDKGIRLPDVAAYRAGVAGTPHMAAADQAIDPTALALETRLAGVRERLGDPASLAGALAGYTRVYDALASAEATRQQVGNSGIGEVKQQRLVRLATRIGDVSAALGKTEEAKRWLLRAVDLSGNQAELNLLNTPAPVPVNAMTPASAPAAEPKRGWFGSSSAGAARDAQGTPIAPAAAALSSSAPATTGAVTVTPPSPPLTRSLIAALLSLSALYAQAALTTTSSIAIRSNLEQALQVQAGTLRIARTEMQRINLVPGSDAKLPTEAKLHGLWLMHHDALVSLHLAETIYAISSSGASASSGLTAKLAGLFSSSAGGKAGVDYAQSKAWLAEADAAADVVKAALTNAVGVGKKGKKNKEELGAEWSGSEQIKVPAGRLLRDAQRVGDAAKEMLMALDK